MERLSNGLPPPSTMAAKKYQEKYFLGLGPLAQCSRMNGKKSYQDSARGAVGRVVDPWLDELGEWALSAS
jgi:hypothetical protein